MDSLRSQFTAECVTMGRDGLWATLLRHAPPPEHREMEQVIGSQRIKRNKASLRNMNYFYLLTDF